MEPITEVIFRKERSGKNKWEITAVVPYLLDNYAKWTMMRHAHVGQHSGCSYAWYLDTIPASPEDYKELYDELTQMGYNLKVIKRINYDRQRLEFRNQK